MCEHQIEGFRQPPAASSEISRICQHVLHGAPDQTVGSDQLTRQRLNMYLNMFCFFRKPTSREGHFPYKETQCCARQLHPGKQDRD